MIDKKNINVLVVDDSKVSRDLMKHIISMDPQLKTMGTAEDGSEALSMLKSMTPDVITMDIVMPNMDGFESTRHILHQKPIPIIIISGIYNKEDVEKSFKAIEAGALAILTKPNGVQDPKFQASALAICQTIKLISEVRLVKRSSTTYQLPRDFKSIQIGKQTYDAIAIGASLGGPQALQKILFGLPMSFPVPIYIVQHIAEGFAEGLVDWLNSTTQLTVVMAKNGEIAKPGFVYIVPNNFQMDVLANNVMILTKDDSKTQLKPSVSHLFKSIANNFGKKAIGVILTGMGRDGVDELLLMRHAGALTIAQSQEDCVMYGMPKAAIEVGAAKKVVSLGEVAALLKSAVGLL